MKSRNLRCLLLTIGVVLFTAGILIYFQVSYQNWAERCRQQKLNETVYIDIRDNYTGMGNQMSISEFFLEAGSLDKLKDVYAKLSGDAKLNYVEIMKQEVDYEGHCGLDARFTVDDSETSLNQPMNGGYITSLKSLQLSAKVYADAELSGKIGSGKGFSEEDYTMGDDRKMSVLLGSAYEGFLQVGDEISAQYLGYEVTGKVIGFLKPGAQVSSRGKNIVLDYYIVAPAVCYTGTGNESFQETLYSVKSTGYVECVYENKEQYDAVLEEIESCFTAANIDYQCQGDITEWPNPIPISTGMSIAVVLSGILLSLMCLVLYEKWTVFPAKNAGSKEKTSFTLSLLWEVCLSGIAGRVLTYLILFLLKQQYQVSDIMPYLVLYCLMTLAVTKLVQRRRYRRS